MKKSFITFILLSIISLLSSAQQVVFYESFNQCVNDDEIYDGFTGGNDDLWSGNIATEISVFTDNDGWLFDNVFGANQCIKLGTSTLQGKATTPRISYSGDAVLTFRAAPWNEEKTYSVTVDVKGGTADKSVFALDKHWNEITVNISDISEGLTISFSTGAKKQRVFIDEVLITAAPADAPAIRVTDGYVVDFGLLGYNYLSATRDIYVRGENLSNAGISAVIEGKDASLFSINKSQLSAGGETIKLTCKTGASVGMHGAALVLKATGTNGKAVEKQVSLLFEVSDLNLQGSGTKVNPYTVSDRILLAENDGTVWSGTYYWVTGYILGAAKRYNESFDGICYNDNLSIVIAQTPDETDMNKIVTVQIGQEAREALNVVSHPENVGKEVSVFGTLLTDKGSPLYLGKPGVRDVNNNDQYVLNSSTSVDYLQQTNLNATMYDLLGRPVGEWYHGIVIQNGKKFILP